MNILNSKVTYILSPLCFARGGQVHFPPPRGTCKGGFFEAPFKKEFALRNGVRGRLHCLKWGRQRIIVVSCQIPSSVSSSPDWVGPSQFKAFLKYCLDELRNNEQLVIEQALRSLTLLIVLRLLEPLIEKKIIDFHNCTYPFEKKQHLNSDKKKEICDLLKMSELAKRPQAFFTPSLFDALWHRVLAHHPKTKDIFDKEQKQGFGIQNSHTYYKLIQKLAQFPFEQYDGDVQGDIYEQIFQNTMASSDFGQYFTPPLVKKLMMNLVNPQVNKDGTIETIFDPALGTGGFLMTALKHLVKQAIAKKIDLDWSFVSTEGLGGREVQVYPYQLARGNMLLSSGHLFSNLEHDDSIKNIISNKYDIVLTNPPFGIDTLRYNDLNAKVKKNYIPIKTNNAILLFLQIIISILKIGGRAAIVLPFGQELFSQKKEYNAVRQYLLKTCHIQQIIKLPKGIFAHTNIETCIVHFIKKSEGKDVLNINIQSSTKTNQELRRTYEFKGIDHNQTIQFYQYSETENQSKIFEIPINEIMKFGYCLHYAIYQYIRQEDAKQYDANIIRVEPLGDLCEFLPKSKRKASYGQKEGLYPFFTSSLKVDSFVDNPDYTKESIIIGTGGQPNVNYCLNGFSTSSDCFVLIKKKDDVNLKYVYYFLYQNLKTIEILYIGTGLKHISKQNIKSIRIPLPPLEHQNKIIQKVEKINCIYENVSNSLKIFNEQNQQCANLLKSNLETKGLDQPKEKQILLNYEKVLEQLETLTQQNEHLLNISEQSEGGGSDSPPSN